MTAVPSPPEPCLTGLCRSPIACNAFGYCRQRNFDGIHSFELAIAEIRRRMIEDCRGAEPLRPDEIGVALRRAAR